ncbi:MAG TPA: NUDIX hydrolase [Nitrososphaeraceae archaeon]|jgi:8-oxo-dGTP diphosphatase|nr:NUDIX hydrolase [Nitrososphaeraceae archaeon]HJY09490.1 NUDIX hydrolase [Nitrososphaeraceae archaeon]
MNEKHYKNPTPTVDAIIQKNSQILLIERKKEPFKGYLVLPGGFVNEGERVEDAAKREVKEETSLDIVLLEILGVYSEPGRDPRGHVMSTVFIGEISKVSYKVDAIAQDDAAAIEWLNIEELVNTRFGFDHRRIIIDYIKWKQFGGTFWSSKK